MHQDVTSDDSSIFCTCSFHVYTVFILSISGCCYVS